MILKLKAWTIATGHLEPVPRIEEAAVLTKSGLVGAMNDLSDGLASELHEIAQASGCGAGSGRSPAHQSGNDSYADQTGADPQHWALFGGEDYELLLTIPGGKGSPLKARKLGRSLMKKTGTPLNFIGRILPASYSVEIVQPDEKIEPLGAKGYDHFK